MSLIYTKPYSAQIIYIFMFECVCVCVCVCVRASPYVNNLRITENCLIRQENIKMIGVIVDCRWFLLFCCSCFVFVLHLARCIAFLIETY